VDGLADRDQLSGLQQVSYTIGHGLLSGRPQVRVLPGARKTAGGVLRSVSPQVYRCIASGIQVQYMTVSERQAAGYMGFTAYFKDSEGKPIGLWETATSS
jgi:hypothetical protein